MMTWSRLLTSLAALSLAACNAQVTVDGGGGGGDDACGDPPPPADGWCPPIWECVDGEWVDLGGACPEPACPETQPIDGDACAMVGQTCSYAEDIPCGPYSEATATCTDDGWIVLSNYCQPEPTCPDTMPEVGSDCSGWDYPYYCPYEIACDELAFVSMSCDYTTPTPTWKIDGDTPACGSCEAAADPSSCAANVGCEWRAPGCAGEGETPIAAGCYPAIDCLNAESCPDPSQQCQVFVMDPCFGAECDACGMQVGVCVAP